MRKQIIYYAIAASLALLVTFVLPAGSSSSVSPNFVETFFSLSSMIFLVVFIYYTCIGIVDEYESFHPWSKKKKEEEYY